MRMTTRIKRINKPCRGFTLIEVLLAMTLLSIMLALLFASLKICANSWERGEQKIFEVGETAGVVNFFQRHLVMARPLWNDFTKEERRLAFQGDSQSLQFVSAFPASAGRAGLQLFNVRLLNENRDNVIKVSIVPFYPVADGEDWFGEDETLIKHVAGFSIAYYGQEEGDSESRWQDRWQDREQLPKLVKINITLENGVFWPEMIFDMKLVGSVDASEAGFDDDEDTGDEDAADDESDSQNEFE